MWEILTFGARPYKELKSYEILKYLESGRRLVQPPTCTIDLYTALLKCETESTLLYLSLLSHLLALCDNLLLIHLSHTRPCVEGESHAFWYPYLHNIQDHNLHFSLMTH